MEVDSEDERDPDWLKEKTVKVSSSQMNKHRNAPEEEEEAGYKNSRKLHWIGIRYQHSLNCKKLDWCVPADTSSQSGIGNLIVMKEKIQDNLCYILKHLLSPASKRGTFGQ